MSLNNLLTCGGHFGKQHPEYRKALLLNMILLTLMPVSVMFIGINTFVFDYIEVVILHSILLVISGAAFVYVQKTRKLNTGSWIVVILILSALFYFVPYNEYDHYGLYWICVFPPVAYFLLGRTKGRLLTLILAAYVLTYLLMNYQTWEHRVFGFEGIVNIGIASVLLVILISYFELSRDEATQHMLRDLELRKKAEEQALEARKIAESADRAKTVFLANMSHEIRTPITSIMGFTELLRSADTASQRMQYINLIENSSRSLLEIINDILDLSKIDAHRMELELHETELEDFLRQVTNILLLQARKKGLLFKLTVSPGFPLVFMADSVRLKQVLINLIGNAIKFTDSGTVHFYLSNGHSSGTEQQNDNAFSARFEVTDTGIGIAAENQRNIFDEFRRGKAEVNRQYSGTGLGLSISAKLVAMMGGEIKLESTPKQGSRFYFEIPLSQAGSQVHSGYDARELNQQPLIEENKLSSHIQPLTSAGIPLIEAPRILVADDVPINTHLLSLFISKLIPDAEMIEANDGQTALQKYKEQPANLIFMDIQMPVMNGPDAIRAIRSYELKNGLKPVPIITLTAGGEDEVALSKEAGSNDMMQKPFTLAEISRILKTHLNTDNISAEN